MISEESATTTSPFELIERNCDRDGISYENGAEIPATSSCQESCTCIDGEVMCSTMKCPERPPSFLRCEETNSLDDCCPSYTCRELNEYYA